MNMSYVTILITLCIMSTHVWGKPQHNPEESSTGGQSTARSSSSNVRLSNAGEPIYGITVVRQNGRLKPSYLPTVPTPVPIQSVIPAQTVLPSPTTTECTGHEESRCKRGSDIIFPTDPSLHCSRNSTTFCEDVEDYPAEKVDAFLTKFKSQYDDLFGEDMIVSDLSQRINGIHEEESLCNSIEKIIYPKVGLTIDNDWKYIVNQKNSTQGVRIELCETPETRCSNALSFPNSYEPVCKQHYIYRQLVGVDEDGSVGKDLFKLPSCCQCVLRRVSRK